MKKLFCLLLAVLMLLAMSACGGNNSDNPTDPKNPGGSNNPTNPTNPVVVMPPAPTEGLSMMDYSAAYHTLTDVTKKVGSAIMGIPSTKEVTTNSVTELTTQDQLDAVIADFADVGYTADIEATVSDTSTKFVNYWSSELHGNNRHFFLANKDYSAHRIPDIQKVVYDAENDALYVMLSYYSYFYGDYQPSERYTDEVANESKAAYNVVALNLEHFEETVEHIVFVTQEKVAVCREDLNVSVVSYDAKYQSLPFFDWNNKGVSASSYSFPSTKAPAANKIDLVTGKDAFLNFQNELNDIVDRSGDTVIFEGGIVEHTHRANGLQQASDSGKALLNILISSPELDPYSTLRCESFFIPVEGQENKYLCGQFFDEATKTVYIYLGYNGQPFAQYEAWSDESKIEETSKAGYAFMSIDFHEEAYSKVENVVIVLPDPATVPAE